MKKDRYFVNLEFQIKSSESINKLFELKWYQAIEHLLDAYNPKNADIKELDSLMVLTAEREGAKPNQTEQEEKKHFLQHIIEDIENKDTKNKFLLHETTINLTYIKWRLMPRFIYYINLFFYGFFVFCYSKNIENYTSQQINATNINRTESFSSKIKRRELYFWGSLILSSTLFLCEIAQICMLKLGYFMNIKTKNIDIKNLTELFLFPLCAASLFYDFFWNDIDLKSSLYSTTILFVYFNFAMRLDKFPVLKIGPYINVFGKIIKHSIPLVVILILFMSGFLLSFMNRSTYYLNSDINQMNITQMSRFNGTRAFNLVQLLLFTTGSLATEQMGIETLQWKTSVNFLIFVLFIFFMTILFINIFTGISIGEVQDLIQNADAEIIETRIKFVLNWEKISNSKILKLLRRKKINN